MTLIPVVSIGDSEAAAIRLFTPSLSTIDRRCASVVLGLSTSRRRSRQFLVDCSADAAATLPGKLAIDHVQDLVHDAIADVGPCGIGYRGWNPRFVHGRDHRFDGEQAEVGRGPVNRIGVSIGWLPSLSSIRPSYKIK